MLPGKGLGRAGVPEWSGMGLIATSVHPSQTAQPVDGSPRNGPAGNARYCHIGWAAHDASGARMSSGAQAPIDGLTT